jgi:hypothetical protein
MSFLDANRTISSLSHNIHLLTNHPVRPKANEKREKKTQSEGRGKKVSIDLDERATNMM